MPPDWPWIINMNDQLTYRERLLVDLDGSIVTAADFFEKVDENLFDGHQTAREVLSHLVFWHHEYCTISKALLLDQKPMLLAGSLAIFNKQATCQFQEHDMVKLAQLLGEEQKTLDHNLRQLKNWNVNFPFKKGNRKTDVAGRVCSINNHIRHHLTRQVRAYRRGEDWIRAYYADPSS